MTDFGKPPGDMKKSVYDTDNDGVVDEAESYAAHAAGHQSGGSDEITVAGLSGELAEDQPAKAHDLGGSAHGDATLAELNAKVSDATLDTSSATRTPASHAASHQDGGGDEVAATGLVGRINYVDRGDADGWDFDIDDFTTDGTTNELDLSAIVPAGASAVNLRIYVADETVGLFARFQKNGFSNTTNCLVAETKIASKSSDAFGVIACDGDRKIQYTTSNSTITAIYLIVLGWFV